MLTLKAQQRASAELYENIAAHCRERFNGDLPLYPSSFCHALHRDGHLIALTDLPTFEPSPISLSDCLTRAYNSTCDDTAYIIHAEHIPGAIALAITFYSV